MPPLLNSPDVKAEVILQIFLAYASCAFDFLDLLELPASKAFLDVRFWTVSLVKVPTAL